MGQFKYGSEKPTKKVQVRSHDGRTIEVPESAAPLYKEQSKPARKESK
ncbi:hypothetical protein [Gulosibacter sp. 10]|nr:hypothetical protein [Gulosibacter sp. 10]SJM61384.1 hypothetical protein FM112_07840 [Gulosibacter sp. 10]